MSDAPKTPEPENYLEKVKQDRAAKKAAKETATKFDGTYFVSANFEATMFDVMRVRPVRMPSTGKLVWAVPAEKAERFAKHHHVVTGRIVAATEDLAL